MGDITELRYFQWLAGEKKGEIHIFDHIEEDDGINYIAFKDKTRINEEFVVPLNHPDATGKMMAEISHPDNGWKFKEEWVGRVEERWEKNADGELVCVEPFIPGRKVTHLIPPKRVAPKVSNFGVVQNAQPTPASIPTLATQTSNINTSDPVYILMQKAKKVDAYIQLGITIALPAPQLYNIAKDSFENGGKKVIEYIIENMSISEIKEAIKKSLTDMYEEEPSNG